jgi:hypothetical protein
MAGKLGTLESYLNPILNEITPVSSRSTKLESPAIRVTHTEPEVVDYASALPLAADVAFVTPPQYTPTTPRLEVRLENLEWKMDTYSPDNSEPLLSKPIPLDILIKISKGIP